MTSLFVLWPWATKMLSILFDKTRIIIDVSAHENEKQRGWFTAISFWIKMKMELNLYPANDLEYDLSDFLSPKKRTK